MSLKMLVPSEQIMKHHDFSLTNIAKHLDTNNSGHETVLLYKLGFDHDDTFFIETGGDPIAMWEVNMFGRRYVCPWQFLNAYLTIIEEVDKFDFLAYQRYIQLIPSSSSTVPVEHKKFTVEPEIATESDCNCYLDTATEPEDLKSHLVSLLPNDDMDEFVGLLPLIHYPDCSKDIISVLRCFWASLSHANRVEIVQYLGFVPDWSIQNSFAKVMYPFAFSYKIRWYHELLQLNLKLPPNFLIDYPIFPRRGFKLYAGWGGNYQVTYDTLNSVLKWNNSNGDITTDYQSIQLNFFWMCHVRKYIFNSLNSLAGTTIMLHPHLLTYEIWNECGATRKQIECIDRIGSGLSTCCDQFLARYKFDCGFMCHIKCVTPFLKIHGECPNCHEFLPSHQRPELFSHQLYRDMARYELQIGAIQKSFAVLETSGMTVRGFISCTFDDFIEVWNMLFLDYSNSDAFGPISRNRVMHFGDDLLTMIAILMFFSLPDVTERLYLIIFGFVEITLQDLHDYSQYTMIFNHCRVTNLGFRVWPLCHNKMTVILSCYPYSPWGLQGKYKSVNWRNYVDQGDLVYIRTTRNWKYCGEEISNPGPRPLKKTIIAESSAALIIGLDNYWIFPYTGPDVEVIRRSSYFDHFELSRRSRPVDQLLNPMVINFPINRVGATYVPESWGVEDSLADLIDSLPHSSGLWPFSQI